MKWIDVGDIKNWINGNQRHCQQTMPKLVCRLVMATANSIEAIDFPSGDSIASGGWDGKLKTGEVSPFYPAGVSAWEIGVEKSASTKAEKDYLKRTQDPLGLVAKETTFVFVTPHVWPGRGEWQERKRAEGLWKDVRVIAIDALELWLEAAPAVSLWLARQIGKVVVPGIRDIEGFWEEWALTTQAKMIPEIVLGGRIKDEETIRNWVNGKPGILEVQGDSLNETFAFLYATICSMPEEEMIKALSRCVVVENTAEVRQCLQAFQGPLIIVAPGECVDIAGAAVAKGHHVFLGMDAKVVGRGDVFRLSRPQRHAVEEGLKKGGIKETEARRLARDFGRGITVLRRLLSRSKAVKAPEWSERKHAAVMVPFLLAGAWSEDRKEDKAIIEKLSGMRYGEFTEKLEEIRSMEDAPVRKVGNVWLLKSPLDAWFLLARYLNIEWLKRFSQAVNKVLSKTDPKYKLSPDKRWCAAIYKKENPYSEWLRMRLAESLVLLAVYGNRSSEVLSTQEFVNRTVKGILSNLKTWEAWASLRDVTPLLAEAAPDVFIGAVAQGIETTPKIFQELLKDDGGGFMSECRHAGLLWALESLAWDPVSLLRVARIFVVLSQIDQGHEGKWGNRPINSLREIFLPRFPQTHASPEERFSVLETIAESEPQLVWKFVLGYFREGMISESHRFRWRDAEKERYGLSPESGEDQQKYFMRFLPLAIKLACREENIVASTKAFLEINDDMRKSLLDTLKKLDPREIKKEERLGLLEGFRNALNWINSYGDGEQHAILRGYVPELTKMMGKFLPKDVFDRVRWVLNTPWPRLPEGTKTEDGSINPLIRKRQAEAARELLDNSSLEKIVKFAETLEHPGVVGHALSDVVNSDTEDNKVLDALLKGRKRGMALVSGYARGMVERCGDQWINKQIERLKMNGTFSADDGAFLYLGLPESAATWAAVGAHGKEVERKYWQQASGYFQKQRGEDATFAVGRLLEVGRCTWALMLAGDRKASIPSKLLKQVIEGILKKDNHGSKGKRTQMDGYHIGRVLDQINKRKELSDDEIVMLEWPFAGNFEHLQGHMSVPFAIHRRLLESPTVFGELVSYMYKRDDHAEDDRYKKIKPKQVKRVAENAWSAVKAWKLFPGKKEDGTVIEKDLVEWVDLARKECEKFSRVRGWEYEIGYLLARAPADPDGTWPHVSVRNLIERLNNDRIDRNIADGIINGRGVVTRSFGEGGEQERGLVEKYKRMAEAVAAQWPRTATLLRAIAAHYEWDAKHEDTTLDLHDSLY